MPDLIDPGSLSKLKKAQLAEIAQAMEELHKRDMLRKVDKFFPDEGPLRRELYPKHLEFFEAGAQYKERCIIAANRIGKSDLGSYEMTLHLTGEYPAWWSGKRFDKPVLAWAAGDTSKTVRDILQLKLIGPRGQEGQGMIPGECLLGTTPKHGIPDAVESVKVRHVPTGGISTVFLKSYDQRREAFQGTEIDVFWCDEEPPEDIYVEGLMRTMTTGGIVMVTFTPLMGISNVVKSFMPGIGHNASNLSN